MKTIEFQQCTFLKRLVSVAMSTPFQNVVLSYLPRHATRAFVQRCFNPYSKDADKVFSDKDCDSVTSESMGRDDFKSMMNETSLCLQSSQCINCFDFVLSMGDAVPGAVEICVLLSLKQHGVACFGYHVLGDKHIADYRAMLDVFCSLFCKTYAPVKMITMAPYNSGGTFWIVPVYRFDE